MKSKSAARTKAKSRGGANAAPGAQLALPLPPSPPKRNTWGGARRGAGRKPSGKAGVPHHARPKHNSRYPVHVSLKLDPSLPNLRTPLCIRTIEACFRAAAEQAKRGGATTGATRATRAENGKARFRLVHYSVQPHHIHLIVEAEDKKSLARGVKGLSIRIARQLNKVLGRRGRVFVDRYHARALATPRETRGALRYVLLNTNRHKAQRRRRAGHKVQVAPRGARWLDPCSSGVYFEGWKEGNFRERWIEELVRRKARGKARGKAERQAAAREELVLPVLPAETWLLRTGWRRWGLLSLADVPGPAAREVRRRRRTRAH